MPQTDQPLTSTARIPALDGLRGVAILMVLVYHATPVPEMGGLVQGYAFFRSILWCGVDLFFVLSGFLITGILLDTKEGPGFYRNFYARRVLRIFPLYYGVLVVLLVLLPWGASIFSHGPLEKILQLPDYERLSGQQAWLWTYTHNFLQARGPSQLPGMGHLWSLAVEEQFYLVWPLVVGFLSRRRLGIVCGLVCLSVFVGRIFLLHEGATPWAVLHWTPTRIDTLAYGALAALLVRDPERLARFQRFCGPLMIAVALGILACGIVSGSLDKTVWATQAFGYSLLGILFAMWILGAATNRMSTTTRLLQSRVLQSFGKISYAIYIFHWPLCRAAEALTARSALFAEEGPGLLLDRLARLLLVLVTSYGLAWLSWHLWEEPWLRLKRFFACSA